MVSPSSPSPQGSRRQVAVIGTLMPHMAPARHHVYRNVTALALLAALIAAGLGSLPVALVLAAVALPAAVLVYIHDHRLWRDEPLTIIVVAFGLSLLLGIGVAFDIYFVMAWRSGERHLLGSALTRAIILSAGTTASAFGTLWISSHPGTASMGELLAISLGWILVTVLFLLPPLLGYVVPDIGLRTPARREVPQPKNPPSEAVRVRR